MLTIQKNAIRLVISLAVVLMTAGCTPNTVMIDEPLTGLNTTPQLNGRVALLLTQSFTNYSTLDPVRQVNLSLGGALSNNASNSMSALFRDLKIVYGPLPAGSPPTLVLVPQVTSAYAGVGAWAWNDRPVSITIKWTLQNQNGVEIWSTSVTGDARGSQGGTTDSDYYLRDFSIAAAKAFRISNERIASSPEVLTALKAAQ